MAEKAPRAKMMTLKALREERERKDHELAIAEAEHTAIMLKRMTLFESRLALQDSDELSWVQMSSGSTIYPGGSKDMPETNRDPQRIRNMSYRMWRGNPHARGIIRSFEKFIIGREFGLDFADSRTGKWNDDRTKLMETDPEDEAQDPPTRFGQQMQRQPAVPKPNKTLLRELWDDFAKMNKFTQFCKEMVRRSFRDGAAYIRKFQPNGFVMLRFIEPDFVVSPKLIPGGTTAQKGDLGPEWDRVYTGKDTYVGKPTTIKGGVEFLTSDPVMICAYWIASGPNTEPERVPISEMIVTKPLADANDPTGILLLEVVMKTIANYTTWEEYRMLLNKFRSAIVLHRKVEGTASQAANLIAGRLSPRQQPEGKEPVTGSGRREAVPAAGTVITSNPGVDWEFKRPNLDAADAEHDGRRMLLTTAAGIGLPEGIVTADWSNNSYSSSVESRTPAVREWEDWQEFFEEPIKQIVEWVIEAGVEYRGLPEDIDREVTIQWPSLITKDADKETNRNALLHQSGLLSLTSWAAREDLDLENEVENMRQEDELGLGGRGQPPMQQDASGQNVPVQDQPNSGAYGRFGGFGDGNYFGEALEDLLREVNEVADAQLEAVTRHPDGKFASEGPCPESGCGQHKGHLGAHGPRQHMSEEAAQWLDMMEQRPEFVRAREIIASQPFTDQLYLHNGVWSPERQALHQRIVQEILNPRAATDRAEQPVLVLYAGAGGSGKGTVLKQYLPLSPDRFTVINADDVKDKLPEYNGYNAANVHEESAHISETLALKAALDARHNIVFDGTGKTFGKYQEIAEIAKRNGYRVELHMAAVDPFTSTKRAADRFLNMIRKGNPKPRYVDPRYLLTNVDGKPFGTYDSLKATGLIDRAVKVDNNAHGNPRLIEDVVTRRQHEARSEDGPGRLPRVARGRDLPPVGSGAAGEEDEEDVDRHVRQDW